jgi:hypothetical protein
VRNRGVKLRSNLEMGRKKELKKEKGGGGGNEIIKSLGKKF